MRWIGQHIWPFKSRFRSDVIIEKNSDLYFNTTKIISNSGATTRLNNIDSIDATTIATLQSAGVGGDITSVVAGSGMTGGATTGAATLNVIGGNGITANTGDMMVTAAQTTITSVLSNSGLVLGTGTDGKANISIGDDLMTFNFDEVIKMSATSTEWFPPHNVVDLGTIDARFKNGYFQELVVSAGGFSGNATTATLAAAATHVTVVDNESTNENNLIPFIEDTSATGNVGLESDGDFHYNPSTGKVTATLLVGDLTGDVTGTADTATVATTVTITDNASTDEDNAVIFTSAGDVNGGNIGLESDGQSAGLTYNPATNRLAANIAPAVTAHNVAGTATSIGAGTTTAGTTADVIGGGLTIHGGQGKGTGTGGEIVFKTAKAAVSTATSLNALSTALTIGQDQVATFSSGIVGTINTVSQPIITTLAGVTSIGTDGDTLNILADDILISNGTASKPGLYLVNTANDATAPKITLANYRDGNGLEDSDSLGQIRFDGTDVSGQGELYITCEGSVSESAHGDECAKFEIKLANDGTVRNGITMEADKATATEVDVTIGNGAASTTTIAGALVSNTSITVGTTVVTDDSIVMTPSTNDTFTIRAAANGAAKLTTVDTAAAAAHFEIEADGDITLDAAGTVKGTPIHYPFRGYCEGITSGNFQYPEDQGDPHFPFQLNSDYGDTVIADGDLPDVSTYFRSSGVVMPRACTAIDMVGWATCPGTGEVTIALCKITPTRDDATTDPTPVVVATTTFTALNSNDKLENFFVGNTADDGQVTITTAAIAKGDILMPFVLSPNTKTTYFNMTLEVKG